MAFVKQVDNNGADGDQPPRKKTKQENGTTDTPAFTPPTNGKAAAKPPGLSFKMPTLPVNKVTKKSEKKAAKETPPPPKEERKHAETDEEKQRTIFLSNISYRLVEPEKKVCNLLLGCGEIEDVRLVEKGKLFRGYGYITFKDAAGAANALLRDRNTIEGRPVFITKYVDKESHEKKKDFKFNDGKEDHRVFVKGFPLDIGEERVIEVFSKAGNVVDVRLPQTREGNRKPFFYVEFSSAFEATKANLALHGKPIGNNNQPVEVVISNPPKRGEAKNSKESAVLDISKTAYATPKNKFMMVPSSVRKTESKKAPPAAKESGAIVPPAAAATSGEKKTGLSNADFKKMFSK